MGPQTRRTFERLQAVVERAGGQLSQTVKQLIYVTNLDAFSASGRSVRAEFIGEVRPASTGVVVRRLADPNMVIEIELVLDLEQPAQGAFQLEKFNAEGPWDGFLSGGNRQRRTVGLCRWPSGK